MSKLVSTYFTVLICQYIISLFNFAFLPTIWGRQICPKNPLVLILPIPYPYTSIPHIIINRNHLCFFIFYFRIFPLTFIFIITLTTFISSLFMRCPNYLCQSSHILSTLNDPLILLLTTYSFFNILFLLTPLIDLSILIFCSIILSTTWNSEMYYISLSPPFLYNLPIILLCNELRHYKWHLKQ